jgi:sigma-E factor negative regulatory protein RseA
MAALFKPVAGLAVAASVAVVAVLAIQNSEQEPASAPTVAAAAPADNAYIRAQAAHPAGEKFPADERLNIYLVNHNEYAVNRGMQGLLPYVRIVGHTPGSSAGKD